MSTENQGLQQKNNAEVGVRINKLSWVFFGTSDVSVSVLEYLKQTGLTPKLLITTPDKPQGRKLILTPPPVKTWGLKNSIKIIQPEKLDDNFISELKKENWDLFIVVAYGKIIPVEILNLPKHRSLNIHYSLLPHLRGAAPVEGAILGDLRETGVSIILMDEKMDHGPIIAQEKVSVPNWPPTRTELMEKMNVVANKLLADIIPKWVDGEIIPKEQNHTEASYVKMIKKEDALIDMKGDGYLNFRKIMAYEKWPRAYFLEDSKRVIINKATWKDDKLEITKVTPEGKKEMDYKTYLNSKKK